MADRVDLDEVRRRYTAEEPPPCRVCGAELSIQSMGGGEATKWACADLPRVGSDEWSDHYRRSGWVQYKHGDPDVLALVDEVADLRALFDLRDERDTARDAERERIADWFEQEANVWRDRTGQIAVKCEYDHAAQMVRDLGPDGVR